MNLILIKKKESNKYLEFIWVIQELVSKYLITNENDLPMDLMVLNKEQWEIWFKFWMKISFYLLFGIKEKKTKH
jgi:predicted nucleotidyltransferase